MLRRSGFARFLASSPVLLQNKTPEWLRQRKQQVIKDRERRALERQGIDVDQDDDAPWVSAEEQARIDAERAERERVMREQEDAARAKRDKIDAEKRSKFKKFRASQLAQSAKQRAKVDASKETRSPEEMAASHRGIVEELSSMPKVDDSAKDEDEDEAEPKARAANAAPGSSADKDGDDDGDDEPEEGEKPEKKSKSK